MSRQPGRQCPKPKRNALDLKRARLNLSDYPAWRRFVVDFVAYETGCDDWQRTTEWGEYCQNTFGISRAGHFSIVREVGLYDVARLSAKLPDAPPRHLYALDADDLLGFTAEDLVQAWQSRANNCGSREAAAELYALIRVLDGTDECYAGAGAYLEHPEVSAIFSESVPLTSTAQVKAISVAPVNGEPEPVLLTLAAVSDLTVPELNLAWANRPESFASLEAAAATLAILRSLNSPGSETPSYLRLLQHELVLELEDVLPRENEPVAVQPGIELGLLTQDRRIIRAQPAAIRPGQGSFRAAMLSRYGGECCVTGCSIETLLEAAHIIPYRGEQSDDVTNGLLLRVDLHRLFDAHLVSINPDTLTVEVASIVSDAGYRAYHGNRLFGHTPKPRTLFLQAHYETYLKAQ